MDGVVVGDNIGGKVGGREGVTLGSLVGDADGNISTTEGAAAVTVWRPVIFCVLASSFKVVLKAVVKLAACIVD